ncbi:hypothetical protein DPMN_055107 [Dreissena polymorpha]|uniref:Uncharacterized protein n=1 Tax=Dreissena polymorpha TaxID=45954 RepID=A0A9D4HRY4_DREPO|nr:hypothetical protein DPMN_055107 [Dreissena polymorpha]
MYPSNAPASLVEGGSPGVRHRRLWDAFLPERDHRGQQGRDCGYRGIPGYLLYRSSARENSYGEKVGTLYVFVTKEM